MCMYVGVHVPVYVRVLSVPGGDIRCPGAGVISDCEPPVKGNWFLDPLEEQQVL